MTTRNRLTTRILQDKDRRQGFFLQKDDRSLAKSQPIQKHSDFLFASMSKSSSKIKDEGEKPLYDWDFVANLQERLNVLYKCEAVSEMGERHSYLNLIDLKYRKNPDILQTV